MISLVKVTNYLNESIELELTNPKKSGFYIREITGLGPPLANINMIEMATADGSIYNSSRVTARNIVITLGFLFNPTIEAVRHLSYKYFPIQRPVKIKIYTEDRIGETIGFVESNEPNIFSKQQTTQISIICPDPYFYSDELMITNFVGVIPSFEFPFSNESLTEKLLVMGEIWPEATRSIYYRGDAETGIIINIFARGEVLNLSIFDLTTNQQMSISSDRLVQLSGFGIIEGDHIIISTVRGDKFITLIRKGVEINILNALNRNAFWFKMHRGDNIFAYTADYGLSNIDFRLENRVLYEGM